MDVDKYLDDAYIAGLKEVTIIHGRGEGILKEGLQKSAEKDTSWRPHTEKGSTTRAETASPS